GHPPEDGGPPDLRGPRLLCGDVLDGQKLDYEQEDQGYPRRRLRLGRVQARDHLVRPRGLGVIPRSQVRTNRLGEGVNASVHSQKVPAVYSDLAVGYAA